MILRNTISQKLQPYMRLGSYAHSLKIEFHGIYSLNPTIFNIIHWVTGSMGQTNHGPSVWYSKYYFFPIISCKLLCKNCFNFFSLFFYKFTVMKIKRFDIRNIKKKLMLGTSDAWTMSCLSHWPNDQAYHIEDFRISSTYSKTFWVL